MRTYGIGTGIGPMQVVCERPVLHKSNRNKRPWIPGGRHIITFKELILKIDLGGEKVKFAHGMKFERKG